MVFVWRRVSSEFAGMPLRRGLRGPCDTGSEGRMTTSIDGESSTRKVEYANLVLSVINEDIGRVQLRVTAALGLATIFITQLPLEALQRLPLVYRLVTVAGIVLLALAAVALFYYTHRLNRVRIKIAS